MAETVILSSPSEATRQWRLAAILLVGVVGVLALVYFMFLRADYVVLASDLRPEEASAIVEQLKKEDVGFKLSEGGTTVLVPANVLDTTRLEMSNTELPIKGAVGFELFNQSDMGLTDFAQKVNYQRALQGELARTIMAMDGIASARVHLALPERSLFRANRSEPKAAVTVTPKANVMLDSDRVAGIQRLIASTVPDLTLDQVAVLNQRGQLISSDYSGVTDSAAMQSASALERAYADRVGRAISAASPELQFDVRVTAVPLAPAAAGGPPASNVSTTSRDHSIRVVIFTRNPLAAEDQAIVDHAVRTALVLNQAAGDDVLFSRTPQTASLPPAITPTTALTSAPPTSEPAFTQGLVERWLIILFAIIAGALIFARAVSVRRLRIVQRDQLVGRIRDQLRITEGSGSAAA